MAFPLVGAATRSWWSLLLPVGGWPLFYAGLNLGWWGAGTGDGWQYAAVLIGVVGLVSTATAIAAGRTLESWRRSRRGKSSGGVS